MAHNDPSEVRNAVTAPDAYTSPGSTIEGTPISRVNIDVLNQGIYWQLKRSASGIGAGQGVWDDVEVFMAPGSRQIVRAGIVGFRFRAAVKAASLPAGATQAVVTIEAIK